MLMKHDWNLKCRMTAAFGGALLAATCGCENSTRTDRAEYYEADAYVVEDEESVAPSRTLSVARPTGARTTAKIDRTKGLRFDTAAKTETATNRSVDPPLSQPIATPLPAQIIATAEAETAPQPATYVPTTTAVSSVAPAAATVPAATAAPVVPTAPVSAVQTASFDVAGALQQADEHNRRGAAAAAKGAWYTARAEFAEALNLIAAAYDATESSTHRSGSLSAGYTALSEAEEFATRTTRNIAAPAASLTHHRTAPFVGPFPPNVSPSTLRAAYLQFASERLSEAATGCEAGSVALHGLGKVHNAAGSTIVDPRAKARVYYEAALVVGPGNFLAANDLAVLLAEEGRLEEARNVLHAALRQSSQPAMWNNLAAVHERLGQPELAQMARREASAAERRAAAVPGSVLPTNNVAWLDARSFAATSQTAPESPPLQVAGKPTVRQATATAPIPAVPNAIGPNSGVPQSAIRPSVGGAPRPVNRALAY